MEMPNSWHYSERSLKTNKKVNKLWQLVRFLYQGNFPDVVFLPDEPNLTAKFVLFWSVSFSINFVIKNPGLLTLHDLIIQQKQSLDGVAESFPQNHAIKLHQQKEMAPSGHCPTFSSTSHESFQNGQFRYTESWSM